jgi:hypothetical protein
MLGFTSLTTGALLAPLVTLASVVLASSNPTARQAAWPNGPFVASGRYVTDASGARVTYAGVNWPGSADIMIPEGLQYQSIAAIVRKIKDLGINSIRLTYATEMVDQIYDNGEQDVTIRKAITDVLGEADGSAIFDDIIANNPGFTQDTTRLQVR